MKTAIIYHYFEKDASYRDNFIFFLNCGLCNDSEYFIYIAGEHSVALPKRDNVNYYSIENRNRDFSAISAFSTNPKSKYFDTYVFINSSARGPFTPTFYDQPWHYAFTSRLTDEIALVGSSVHLGSDKTDLINDCISHSKQSMHAQTYAFALSRKSFLLLKSMDFFTINKIKSKESLIKHYEVRMSEIFLQNGFSIYSLLPTQEGMHIDSMQTHFPSTTLKGDPIFKSAFYGRSPSPFETIFVKTNRNVISLTDLASYTFTALAKVWLSTALNQQAKDLLEMSYKIAFFESKKFVMSYNELTRVLTEIKKQNPSLANQLKKIL